MHLLITHWDNSYLQNVFTIILFPLPDSSGPIGCISYTIYSPDFKTLMTNTYAPIWITMKDDSPLSMGRTFSVCNSAKIDFVIQNCILHNYQQIFRWNQKLDWLVYFWIECRKLWVYQAIIYNCELYSLLFKKDLLCLNTKSCMHLLHQCLVETQF